MCCFWAFFDSLYAQKETALLQVTPTVLNAIPKCDPSFVKIGGHLGERINACEERRIKGQSVHALTEPFFHKTETWRWQTEFWGKWTLGAILAYRYNRDSALLDSIKDGINRILDSQLPDGYIGNYTPETQLQQWDIWGRKYTLLGLLSYYNLTSDRQILNACCRLADHLLSQVGYGKIDIISTGNYRGMPSSSILEPMVYLYSYTNDNRYLDFAQYIVTQWETRQGPQLISKSEAGIPVAERFPHPGSEENWVTSGQKAYEMMSCYEGLLELYKITGNRKYLTAVEKTVHNIIDTEINIAGSGSAHECWYHGKTLQTQPTYHTMETCVTMTWMKLCQTLLSLTGNPLYADQIEKSACNALLASMKDDAAQIAMYSPLTGKHFFTSGQCGMYINCCSANAPRAFASLPELAVMQADNDIFINLYTDLSAELFLNKKQKVSIMQQTLYPENGLIKIRINTGKPAKFTLSLRIPARYKEKVYFTPTVSVNGEKLTEVKAGEYYKINRIWKKDDLVELELDVRARIIKDNGFVAIVKGPVVLARDSRFLDGLIDEEAIIVEKDGFVELTPVSQKPAGMWMAFTAPMKIGTFPVGITPIHFCDFGSAGNSWAPDVRHRVWIQEIVDTTKPNNHVNN
jgi:DUF1680 family protein